MKKMGKFLYTALMVFMFCGAAYADEELAGGTSGGLDARRGEFPNGVANVVINGGVAFELPMKLVERTAFAEGKSLFESLRPASDAPQDFNYQNLLTDDDEIYSLLSAPYEGISLAGEEYEHLLSCDAIIITSYQTDQIAYMLFVDRTEAVEFKDSAPYSIQSMSETPRDINGEVYIPIEAFAELAGYESEITVSTGNAARPYFIPEWSESAALIEDWTEGPVSLYVPMEETEVIAEFFGTYAGYSGNIKDFPGQQVFVFGNGGVGTMDYLGDDDPVERIEWGLNFNIQNPMFDNMNGWIVVHRFSKDGTGYGMIHQLVAVAPGILYEPNSEAIYYKVD